MVVLAWYDGAELNRSRLPTLVLVSSELITSRSTASSAPAGSMLSRSFVLDRTEFVDQKLFH